MSKPSGFALALVCLAMGLLTVQSATVVNQLKDDTKGHVELMKEVSDHDHDAFEAAASTMGHNESTEETGMVGGQKWWHTRRRHTDARDGGPWQQVTTKELLKTTCDKCAAATFRIGWQRRHSDACSQFAQRMPDSNTKIHLPEFKGFLNPGQTANDKCFYPSVTKRGIFGRRRRIIHLDGLRIFVPSKVRKGCECLKKLVLPRRAGKGAAKPEDSAKQFLCNCRGFCSGFQTQITPQGYCPPNSLVEQYKQNQSAVPENKALMRSERRVSKPTVSQQVLMRKEAASESKQESGTFDETLECKCPPC